MPDERLMQHLERKRDRGRDDYPVRAMWNSILAGVIYQHPSIESLIRELSRNSQLRRICGFADDKVLSSWAYSRFLANLFKHEQLINERFAPKNRGSLKTVLPPVVKTKNCLI
jgi:transposase